MSRINALAGLGPDVHLRRVESRLKGSKAYWEFFDASCSRWKRLLIVA